MPAPVLTSYLTDCVLATVSLFEIILSGKSGTVLIDQRLNNIHIRVSVLGYKLPGTSRGIPLLYSPQTRAHHGCHS